MNIFDSDFYKSCKWFLIHTGMWPYQNDSTRRIGHWSWYAVNLTLVIPQIFLLCKDWSTDVCITVETCLSLLFIFGCSAKYSLAQLRMPQLKLLLTKIAQDWELIKNESELQILHKYSEEGRKLVMFYTIYIGFAWITMTLSPFLPYMLDTISPLKNGTRPLLYSFYADYIFFKQTDHHYLACTHGSIVFLYSTFLFAGIDSLFLLTVKHTCGLFAITSSRLTVAASFKRHDKIILDLYNEVITEKNLKDTVILHNRSISCNLLLENSFSICFLYVQAACVISLAIEAVYMLYIRNDFHKLSRNLALSNGLVIHLFCLNWVGQQIINSSEEVLYSAYFSEWYYHPLKVRKSTGIIITRTLYPCYLTAGKLVMLSMESFEKIMKTTISYFTVLSSII